MRSKIILRFRIVPAWLVVMCFMAFGIFSATTSALAQFEDDAQTSKEGKGTNGPKLDQPLVQKIRIGIEVTAVGGPCKGIFATLPVPMDWDEQKVKIVDEKETVGVSKVTYRNLVGAKQMIVNIPNLPSGQTASAYVTFEVTRYSLAPPEETSKLHIPTKFPVSMNNYLSDSPYIESHDRKIIALAKEIPAANSDWEKIEAIYDLTRTKMKYEEGAIRGAVKGLTEGKGDCEDLSALFIAVCRQQKIPARTIWVDGHCYPEFYMEDDQNKGYWFPCQAAGQRAFGGIPEHKAILQKGDSFHDPDRPKERLRYVSEFMKGMAVKGGGDPKHKFIREVLPD